MFKSSSLIRLQQRLPKNLVVLSDNNLALTTQRRWNWQVFLRRRFDRRTGQYKYEDWDDLIMSFQEPSLSSGVSLRQRDWAATEHIKPTERKRRINSRKTYDRDVKRIEDLTNYIKFIQDNKDEK